MKINETTISLRHKISFISLQTKLIVGFTLIFTLVFGIAYYWFYTFALDNAKYQIKEDLYQTIRGATQSGDLGELRFKRKLDFINGDEMEKLINEGVANSDQASDNPHTDDPLYWEQLNVLCELIRVEPRAKPYTYIPGHKENELIFITSYGWCLNDATTKDFATFKQSISFGRVDANLAGLNQIVFQKKIGWCVYEDDNCVPEIYTDSYGSWISAFAPIKNSRGKTVAVLGVDFTAGYVNDVQRTILDNVYIAFGLTYAILLGLVYLVAQTLARPLARVTKAAEQIGEGNYDTGVKYLSELSPSKMYPDEIALLSVTMLKMTNDLDEQRRELINNRSQMQELVRTTIQAQETERRYYSRELHDQAGQMLVTLKLKMQTILAEIPDQLANQPKGMFDHELLIARLNQVLIDTDATLNMIRNISHQMRPTLLDMGDVNLAYENQCNEFAKLTGLQVSYESMENIEPSEEVAVSLFRFLQESLTNIHKHAKEVTSVVVRVNEQDGQISMSVSDNGKGTKTGNTESGIGILGIRERFLLLGGYITTQHPPEGGFVIKVRVPQKTDNAL